MDDEDLFIIEVMLLMAAAVAAGIYLCQWYLHTFSNWPRRRNLLGKTVFGLLPPVVIAVILATLLTLSDAFVRSDPFYIIFYTVLGLTFVSFCAPLMSVVFDISWRDDALNNGGHGAIAAIFGGAVGFAIIYAGANVGDGPGWWCVVFAVLPGYALWLLLGWLLTKISGTSKTITVNRDVGCGIRTGAFFIACAAIIGRAVSGDWTDAGMTLYEFLAAWQTLPLFALALGIELYARKLNAEAVTTAPRYDTGRAAASRRQSLAVSAIIALAYLAIAAATVLFLPPMPAL